MGHVVYKNGAGIGPDRIKSINYLETPKTRKKLESFLEMINYCSKFIINLCKETAYLYGLIKKNADINWKVLVNGERYVKAINSRKEIIDKSCKISDARHEWGGYLKLKDI